MNTLAQLHYEILLNNIYIIKEEKYTRKEVSMILIYITARIHHVEYMQGK
jgi:hypothetical protein